MSEGSYIIKRQEDYCVRCRVRTGIFNCADCGELNFCDQCEFYVHSINSKKCHRRTHISQLPEAFRRPDEDFQQEQNVYSSQNLSYHFDNPVNKSQVFSHTNSFHEPNIYNVANHSRMSTNPTTLYDITNKSINKFNLEKSHNRSSSNEKLYEKRENNSSGPFSKEYIQEMKNFHEREKRELLLKNSSLIENIDQIKSEFQKQISDLQTQIEEGHKKNQLNLSIIEEENQLKLKKILTDKENELKLVYTKLKEQEEINEGLIRDLNQKTQIIQEIKYTYHERFNELDYAISQNEKEFLNMKQFYEDKINYLESHYTEEKAKLIEKYEDGIQSLVNGHNKSKEKLNSIINERENDMKIQMDKAANEQKNLKDQITELKKQLDDEKRQKTEALHQIEVKDSEIEILNRNIEKLKKDSKDYLNQLKLFENENKGLIDEKEDLKGKLSKFDRIVYGKIKKSNK